MIKNVILFLLISFFVTNTYCKSPNEKIENDNKPTNYAYRILTLVVVSAISYGAYNIYCSIKERVKRQRQQAEKWEEYLNTEENKRREQRKKWQEHLNTEENKRREQQKKWEEYLNTEENKIREQRKKWEEFFNTKENKRRERQKKWEEFFNTKENKRREREKIWEEFFNTKENKRREREKIWEEFFNNGNDYFKNFSINPEMKEIRKLSDELMERKDFKTINQEVFNSESADELLKDLSNSEKTHKQAISKFYREISRNYLSDVRRAQDNENNRVEQEYAMTFNPLIEALKKHDSPQTTKNTVKRLAVKDNWGGGRDTD